LKKPIPSRKPSKIAAKKLAPAATRSRTAPGRPATAAKAPVKPVLAKLSAAKAPAQKIVAQKMVVAKPPVPNLVQQKLGQNKFPQSKILQAKGAVSHKPAARVVHAARARRPAEPEPVPVRIVEAVPTDGKPRKNQAGFSSKELEHFRDLLLAKRRELVGDMTAMEREALRTSGGTNLSTLPIHMADMGTDNYEQEFTLGLVEKDRNLLKEINSGLAKIMNGTYGLCEGTGKPITSARLEAAPWARFSIEWARQLERRGRM
jgi:RNA polymerase-binding protein DksA